MIVLPNASNMVLPGMWPLESQQLLTRKLLPTKALKRHIVIHQTEVDVRATLGSPCSLTSLVGKYLCDSKTVLLYLVSVTIAFAKNKYMRADLHFSNSIGHRSALQN